MDVAQCNRTKPATRSQQMAAVYDPVCLEGWLAGWINHSMQDLWRMCKWELMH